MRSPFDFSRFTGCGTVVAEAGAGLVNLAAFLPGQHDIEPQSGCPLAEMAMRRGSGNTGFGTPPAWPQLFPAEFRQRHQHRGVEHAD